MASRYEVEVTVSSAKDLKNVNWRYGPTKPYVILWVNPDRKVTTRTCDGGDSKSEWNQKLFVPLDCPVEEATLYVDIVHHAAPEEDTKPLIGSAKLSLSDIVNDEGIGNLATRKLKVKRPSGRPQGKLELEIMLRDLKYRGESPYPPPHAGYGESPYYAQNKSAYSYGEQPRPAYGEPAPYGYPTYGQAPAYGEPAVPYGNHGYGGQPPAYGEPAALYGNQGYDSQPPTYGEPVPAGQGGEHREVEEEKKKSKFGGMGTGLAVGAVAGVAGGLAIGYGIHKLTQDDDDDEEEEEEEEKEAKTRGVDDDDDDGDGDDDDDGDDDGKEDDDDDDDDGDGDDD